MIVPSAGNGTDSSYMYVNWSSNGKNYNQVNYYPLLLLISVSKHEINKLFYAMEIEIQLLLCEYRNVELRNNVMITIGEIV